MCKGSPIVAARATERRRIVPLPLFWLPSTSSNKRSPLGNIDGVLVYSKFQISICAISILEFEGKITYDHRKREIRQTRGANR